MRRGEVWDVEAATGSHRVLVLSISEANARYGAAVVLVLHPEGAFPDTVLSVALKSPVPASAFALNLAQMRSARFDPSSGARRLGSVDDADLARIESAVRTSLAL